MPRSPPPDRVQELPGPAPGQAPVPIRAGCRLPRRGRHFSPAYSGALPRRGQCRPLQQKGPCRRPRLIPAPSRPRRLWRHSCCLWRQRPQTRSTALLFFCSFAPRWRESAYCAGEGEQMRSVFLPLPHPTDLFPPFRCPRVQRWRTLRIRLRHIVRGSRDALCAAGARPPSETGAACCLDAATPFAAAGEASHLRVRLHALLTNLARSLFSSFHFSGGARTRARECRTRSAQVSEREQRRRATQANSHCPCSPSLPQCFSAISAAAAALLEVRVAVVAAEAAQSHAHAGSYSASARPPRGARRRAEAEAAAAELRRADFRQKMLALATQVRTLARTRRKLLATAPNPHPSPQSPHTFAPHYRAARNGGAAPELKYSRRAGCEHRRWHQR